MTKWQNQHSLLRVYDLLVKIYSIFIKLLVVVQTKHLTFKVKFYIEQHTILNMKKEGGNVDKC